MNYQNKTCTLVDVRDINVDTSYQRVVRRSVLAIKKSFDWRRFGVPMVSLREDGTYWVIDGQHRVEACKLYLSEGKSDDWTIWCDVLTSLTKSDEALLFAMQGDNRTNVTPMEKLKAALQSVDKNNPYVIVHNLIQEYGLNLVPTDGHQLGVRCLETLKMFAVQSGKDCVDYILSVVKRSGWYNYYEGTSRFWTVALRRLYLHGVDAREVAKYLKENNPQDIITKVLMSVSHRPTISDCVSHITNAVSIAE